MKKIAIFLSVIFLFIFLSCPAAVLAADTMSVAEALERDAETLVQVEGIFVGVADTYSSSAETKEILIKDVSSNAVIAVQGVPYGTFPNTGYTKGDKLSFSATVKLSSNTNIPTKKYLEFSSDNGAIETTIVSSDNPTTFDLSAATEVNSWAQMKTLFTVDALQPYSLFKFTGTTYLNYYSTGKSYRPHKNASATKVADIKPDGTRTLAFQSSSMEANLGSGWKSLFFESEASGHPGTEIDKTFYMVYTGADGYRFYFSILDESWVVQPSAEISYTNEDIVKEVAYAYLRQGSQIEYDKQYTRRHNGPSPEDATAQHKIYLDCSSYVNACYIEAFGEGILPPALGIKSPSTASHDNYARDNGEAADVFGYWEQTDYDTAEERAAIVELISSQIRVGDVLTYRHGTASSTSGHTYIYVGNSTFLHRPGAGSYTVVADNPALSYDNSASEQTGRITTVDFDTIFTNTSHTRYIFKATTSDTVKSFSILRPLARDLTPTQETLGRMTIAGLEMEKLSSVYENTSVCPGDIITYSVKLENGTSSAIDNIALTDTLPEGTEFVSGSDGVSVNGRNITWSGKLLATRNTTVSYDVKVTATTPGALILSNATYVNGVKLGNITHSVSTYSDMHRLLLTDKAQEYIAGENEFDSNVAMVRALYSDALGISLDEYASPEAMLDDLIDSANYTCRTDTELSKMIVPHLFGGMSIRAGHYTIPDNERTRLVSKEELAVGDIIVADWSGGNIVYVYAGGTTLLSYENGKAKVLTIGDNIYGKDADNILVSLYAYDRYAVLRPSMANKTPTVSITEIEVTTPPEKLAYNHGEKFDPSGMVVTAIMSNGNTMEVTGYTISPENLSYGTTSVTVSFDEVSTMLNITVSEDLKKVGVAEAAELEEGNLIEVDGYYVGVAREGNSSIYEMLVKDLNSDTFLSVRGVPYGTYPDYGYKKGDRIRFAATIMGSTATYTAGKKYLDFSDNNGTIDSTIISTGNNITYSLEEAVTVSSWSEMKSKFKNDIDFYTIVKFTGTTYINYCSAYNVYRLHMNSAATSLASIRVNGTRYLTAQAEHMKPNIGMTFNEMFGVENDDSFPGTATSKTFYALYTGGNTNYYSIVILDENWIMDDYEIIGASDDGKTVSVNLPEAGTYSVIFADFNEYNPDKFNDYDEQTVTVTQPGRANVTTTKNFFMGKNDKAMLWKNLVNIEPLCSPYYFE